MSRGLTLDTAGRKIPPAAARNTSCRRHNHQPPHTLPPMILATLTTAFTTTNDSTLLPTEDLLHCHHKNTPASTCLHDHNCCGPSHMATLWPHGECAWRRFIYSTGPTTQQQQQQQQQHTHLLHGHTNILLPALLRRPPAIPPPFHRLFRAADGMWPRV